MDCILDESGQTRHIELQRPEHPLLECLRELRDSDGGYIKLNAKLAAILGPAAETVARLAAYPHVQRNGCTFATQKELAAFCGVSLATYKRHIEKLGKAGLVNSGQRGRDLKRGKFGTRTAMLELSRFAIREHSGPTYFMLPRWVCSWAWSERLTFAFLLSFAFLDERTYCPLNVGYIAKRTGLAYHSAAAAVQALIDAGRVVDCETVRGTVLCIVPKRLPAEWSEWLQSPVAA